MRRAIGRLMYRYGWDTRCRNRDALKAIRGALDGDGVLDVGCGPGGLAMLLPGRRVTGLDVNVPDDPSPNLHFVPGSITDLPFGDRAFGVVSCIDTLEHLPPDVRTAGIAELVRVASRALVITCPDGETARRCDREFADALETRGRPAPPWLAEHQAHPYPTVDGVSREIGNGRTVRITVHRSESIRLRRMLLAAAARSKVAWAAANLAAGLLVPVLPEPSTANSYRFVLLAEFE